MSVFSDLLKNYIHEKNVKVMSLAHYCNLERSTVYKFINGKREPMSVELVEQIAYFIKLTPLESYQLKEAWKVARMGERPYYIRKSIEHFMTAEAVEQAKAPMPELERLYREAIPETVEYLKELYTLREGAYHLSARWNRTYNG